MGRIEYRDFDGDGESLSALAHTAWTAAYGEETWYDLFRPELLQHLHAEVPDPRFLVAGYDGGKLVAFIANLPRRYRLNGKSYLGVVATQLTVHPDYLGAGVYLIAECLRRNADLGADFVLMQFDKTGSAWRIFDYLQSGYRIEALRTMIMIARPVDLERIVQSQHLSRYEAAAIKLLGGHRPIDAPPVSGQTRSYRDTDLAAILGLIDGYSDLDRPVRVFNEETLARRLHTPGITSTVVYERKGAVAGLVNYTLHEMVSPKDRTRWAWLDFVFWEELGAGEKKALLGALWQTAREQGCIGLMEWNRGYYSPWPLFRSRFVPYPRFVQVSAWVFNPDLSFRNVDCLIEQIV